MAAIKRRGLLDAGHFDQYLIEKIQILTKKLFGASSYSTWPSTLEWCETKEGFGLISIPKLKENLALHL